MTSNDTKHTPGPWIDDGETRRGRLILLGEAENGGTVLVQGPNREANARLIVAAPELLTLVRQTFGPRDGKTFMQLSDEARKLLARIDGEQTESAISRFVRAYAKEVQGRLDDA